MKKIRYFVEFIFLALILLLFKLLPVATASACGGWIGRIIGPRLAASRKALRNIELAFPDATAEQRQKILIGMWDNLGRIVAEYPHLKTIAQTRTEIIEAPEARTIRLKGQNSLYCGAHFGNWEINCLAAYFQLGLKTDITYRRPNNPYIDRLLQKARMGNMDDMNAHAKGREGGKAILRALKEKKSLGILIDQKYNEGVAVPFFGTDAMTNPAFVQLAQKYDCPIIMIRNERQPGAHFKLYISRPLATAGSDGATLPVEDVIKQAHIELEAWILDHPDQWLWLHRRWDSKKLENKE